MKFKIGQKVRVREDLEVDKEYGCLISNSEMVKLKGQIFEIEAISCDDDKLIGLKDENRFNWTEFMLEPVEEKNCDNCKHNNTYCLPCDAYFDCSQCEDFDEWQKKDNNYLKIILISGKAQHGKDATANMLKEKLESKGKKVLIAHYGDLVKYTCKTFFNWNGEKDEQGRTILQEVGTDRIRAKHPNFWVDYIRDLLSIFEDKWDYVLIPDTRFPNEIDVMKNTFKDVISLRVVRTNFISPLTEEQRNHRSEIALDDYPFDYYFIADDLKTLERKVDNLLKELEDKQ